MRGCSTGLDEADLAFILDPVDGTMNFACGLPLFGVMAAAVMKGEVVGGIILDPISDDWAVAVRGEGAWVQRPDGSTIPLRVASAVPLEEMTGNVSWRYLPKELRPVVTGNLSQVAMAADLRCSAHTYRQTSAGYLHFSFSSSVHAMGSRCRMADPPRGRRLYRAFRRLAVPSRQSRRRPHQRAGQDELAGLRDALLPPQA